MKLTPILESLSKEQAEKVFATNPNFFKHPRYVGVAIDNGLYDFVLDMSGSDLNDYIDGDHVVRRYTDKHGRSVVVTLFDQILSGDTWDLYEPYTYDGDWESAIDYQLNEENEKTIRDMIYQRIVNSGKGYDVSDFQSVSLQDLIEEWDEDDEIKQAIRSANSDSESGEYSDYLYNTLKSACEDLGELIQFNDEGVKVKIDFREYVVNNWGTDYTDDEDFMEDLTEKCDYDSKCLFEENIDHYGEKISFRPDDRWSPSGDAENFNENLRDRLGEI